MRLLIVSSACLFLAGTASGGEFPDYKNTVLPIMKEHCWDCHSNENKVKGNLALDDLEEVRDYQIGEFNLIRPGNPDESNFIERLLLSPGHTDFMPRKGEPLPKKEIEVIQAWIKAGAIVDENSLSDEEKTRLAEASTPDSLMKPEFQTWVNKQGKSIRARFLRLVGNKVEIQMENGQRYQVPLEGLSSESIAQARQLSGQ